MDGDERPPDAGNLTKLTLGDREIFLLGTAHVSKKSVEEVRQFITEIAPDTVCVELDQARYETLADDSRFRRMKLADILAKGRIGLFLASLLFAAFQKRLGDRLGVRPGAEMLAAVEAARSAGAEVVLADRDVQTTLARCYASLGAVERLKITLLLGMLPFAAVDIDEAQVEELKSKETMGDALEAFARQLPALKVPLIDERDAYLAGSVRDSRGKRTLVVVGAAHVPGIARRIAAPVDREALRVLPKKSVPEHVVPYLVPLAALAVFGLALLRAGSATAATFVVWPLAAIPSALAAACVAAVGGAAVTALLAALLTPVSLLVPALPLGKTLARVQASLSPPAEEDAERLRDDVLSPANARKNPFLKAVLSAVAASFGRSLGFFVGLVWAVVRALH